ncbi:MAG: site-2 protease family protein [Parvibaculaceae bacterium]
MIKALFLFLASLKLGKLLLSVGSMLVTIWVYTTIHGLPFAAGFVGLILVHELGHYAAARQRGLAVGLPMFIPFLGAWITLKDRFLDAETEAYVAYAGPFIGTLGAFAVYFLARAQESDLLMALAYSGFMINLFNLIPLSPLDGGRITQILSPRIWFLGVPMLIALFFYIPSPLLILIAIFAAPSLIAAWRYDPDAPDVRRYRDVPAATRMEYTIMYLGLAAVLALLAYNVHAGLRH